MLWLLAFVNCATAQSPVTFRYFYDGNNQLFRVLDSSGNLVEYDYDPAGNPVKTGRSVVNPTSLSLLNFLPQRGNAGTTVTIYGQNFNPDATADIVMFNGLQAVVVSASPTTLVVQAPVGVTTGPLSVTANGATATSGSLNFVVGPPLPVITSIDPPYGSTGAKLTVSVQGANLDGATFQFAGAGSIVITSANLMSSTQATLNIQIGQIGLYVLVAYADNGVSSTQPAVGNTFHVYGPPGSNYSFLRMSVFNTYLPAGNSPGVPSGSNAAVQRFSTFNTFRSPGAVSNLSGPPGSNAAFQRLSMRNGTASPALTPTFSVSRTASPAGVASGDIGSTVAGVRKLIAGETLQISVSSRLAFMPSLQFMVNGVPLASSSKGALSALFTVPHGATTLTLQTIGQTADGQTADSLPEQFSVVPDSGRIITGRVVDKSGQPVAGASVTWRANGLAAEYYRLDRDVRPERTGYVSAINDSNPQEVFGKDPLGAGLEIFTAHFHGKILIAAAGEYQFLLRANSAVRLVIDGKACNPGARVTLAIGAHDVEAIYTSEGATSIELVWTPPDGVEGIVPPSALETGSEVFARADGRFTLNVPAALDGVEVMVTNGKGSAVLDP